MRAQAALIRPNALPSLRRFVDSGWVTRAVVGTVAASRPRVGRRSGSVDTLVTVRTDDALGGCARTIEVSESGGVVPLRAVRDHFASKLGPILEEQLDQLVDYRSYEDGVVTHPVVGERDPPDPRWVRSLTERQVVDRFGPLLRVG